MCKISEIVEDDSDGDDDRWSRHANDSVMTMIFSLLMSVLLYLLYSTLSHLLKTSSSSMEGDGKLYMVKLRWLQEQQQYVHHTAIS